MMMIIIVEDKQLVEDLRFMTLITKFDVRHSLVN